VQEGSGGREREMREGVFSLFFLGIIPCTVQEQHYDTFNRCWQVLSPLLAGVEPLPLAKCRICCRI
jgi:hypothetical protein